MLTEMPIYKLDHHLLAAFLAAESATAVLGIMPSADLVEELRNLIYLQHDILIHMIEGSHYGTNNLNNFIEYTKIVKEEIKRIKDEDI